VLQEAVPIQRPRGLRGTALKALPTAGEAGVPDGWAQAAPPCRSKRFVQAPDGGIRLQLRSTPPLSRLRQSRPSRYFCLSSPVHRPDRARADRSDRTGTWQNSLLALPLTTCRTLRVFPLWDARTNSGHAIPASRAGSPGHSGPKFCHIEAAAEAAIVSWSRKQALVAQLDRASDFESEGREFESLRARQFMIRALTGTDWVSGCHTCLASFGCG
jgi:hypothetical protein